MPIRLRFKAAVAAPSGTITTVVVNPEATGTFPYLGAIYPLEGEIVSGQSLSSPDDSSLRGTVISTWPDGSAANIVFSGAKAFTSGVPFNIRLEAGTPGGANLSASDIDAVVTGITVNVGGGDQSINDFTTPAFVWWANPAVICARYVLGLNVGVMEAIIDIHCFADGRALVEVVIENCRVTATSSPTLPTNRTYTGATVVVNGSTIATVTTPTNGQTFSAPTDGSGTMTWGTTAHEGLRAWYCKTWVGGSDPQTVVTHDPAYLQQHPMFMKIVRTSSGYNMATNYGSDAYTPFSHQRHAPLNMGGTGDNKWIGHLPLWEMRYLQSGDKNAHKATTNSALGVLTFAVNYRDATTTLVPSFSQIGSKSRNTSTWPQASNGSSDPAVWEVAHQPAAGLMAFLCRPSPVFIEIAQKVAVWSSSWTDPTSFMSKFYQTRGRGWAFRNLAHAIFVTPNVHSNSDITSWRSACATKLVTDIGAFDQFRTAANNFLEVVVDGDAGSYLDHCPNSGVSSEGVGFQNSLWQQWLSTSVIHCAHKSKLLSGTDQTNLNTLADWIGKSVVRYINEMPGDEWKYIRHMTTCGQQNWNSSNGSAWGGGLYSGNTMDSLASWDLMDDWWMTDSVVATNNWKVSGNSTGTQRDYASGWSNDTVANTSINYATWFWSALVAAVERGITGADAAWTKVNTLSGLSTWLDGYATDPRQGFYPRNK